MGCFSQPYYEKGLAEGRSEGRAETAAKILARLLEKRFGEIPASFRQRIFAADMSSLETWVERAFDARDLQSIFDPN